LFLTAVIKAVDEYQDLLRISASCAGNDHRLGANEAPPAIVSMFLGEELTEILEAIENDASYNRKEKVQMKIGVHVIPKFPKDTTDRNRTSPFAFTGNKFEFRMVGSSMSIADANTTLNTAVAKELKEFADYLEEKENFTEALHDLIKKTIVEHKRIIFNGNGYNDEWIKEAEDRGLLNLKSTPECLPYLVKDKNVALFSDFRVFTETELRARYEIMLENYVKTIRIEAFTMIDMVNKDILPAISAYTSALAETVARKKSLSVADSSYETTRLNQLSSLEGAIFAAVEELDGAVANAADMSSKEEADYFHDTVFVKMQELRAVTDRAETLMPSAEWPYPSYGELLFGVR
ncbi:MAG: glutamine synthetase type III, partial [Christensenellales bacterium]